MTSSATNPDRGAQSRAGKAVHFKTQPDGPGGGRPCWGLWSSHPRPGWARRARRTRQQQASGVAAGWSRCAGGAAPPAGRHGHRRGEGRSGLPGGPTTGASCRSLLPSSWGPPAPWAHEAPWPGWEAPATCSRRCPRANRQPHRPLPPRRHAPPPQRSPGRRRRQPRRPWPSPPLSRRPQRQPQPRPWQRPPSPGGAPP